MKKYKIDFSFYLLIICFLFSPYQNILLYLILMIAIHEAGHLLFVFIFNLRIKSLRLYALGFLMDLKEENLTFIKELLLYSGGIIFNVCSLFLIPMELRKYLYLIIVINIIPIFPLDGYMIVRCLLSNFIPYKMVLYIVNSIGIIFSLILSIILFKYLDGLLIINIGYLWIIQLKEFKNIKFAYSAFKLRRYLKPPKFNLKEIKFRFDNDNYLYKYKLICTYVGDKRVDEIDILKLKYEIN
ncbi:MAG: hypothetical protein E7176_03730 [Erysipelotrichaceae bacterium]|nr:hypothetical protein [Erysipelotrichaceae bacterium]